MLAARNRARANIAVAKATQDQAETELRDATQSYQRAQTLVTRKVMAQPDYDAAENRYRRAKNADIGDIVTPLGAAANARASVITIADMGSYQVEADVSETNIGQVKVG